MSGPVPSSKYLEDLAFKCAVGLAILIVCAIVDGHDGVARWRRGQTHRLWEDPDKFWGALLIHWGYPAILAALGLIAFGIGALVARGVEKASTDK